MPGQQTITINRTLRTALVQHQLHTDDEAAIISGQGSLPAEYDPKGSTLLISQGTDGQEQLRVDYGEIPWDHPDLTSDQKTLLRNALLEWYTMPHNHALAAAIMRGEFPEAVVQSAAWRARYDGIPYDLHDGSGEFTVTADE